MTWTIKFEERAFKEFERLDKKVQREIVNYLHERVLNEEDPRRHGKPLKGKLQGLWRYRIGSYRVICQIKDEQLLLLVVRTAHRRKVYL